MTIDLDEARIARNETGLWLGWTLATTLGMLVGFGLASLFVDDLETGLAWVLVPLLTGFLVGFFQWFVLRGYLTRSSDWILFGGAGWAIGYALGLLLLQVFARGLGSAWIAYPVFGLVVSLATWPVLSREIPNLLPWVIANILGWTLGFFVSQFAVTMFFPSEPLTPIVGTLINSTLTGLVAGAITGLAFVRIVRQPERIT